MKIWVLGRGYPTPENKMWGSFELEQAQLLARSGHDVSYIALTLSFFNRKDPRGLRIFNENGIKVFVCSCLYFPGKLGIYWEKFEDKLWRFLFEKAKSETGFPDIIHIHYPSMLSSINIVEEYRKKGVRLFVTEHWSRVLINKLLPHEISRLRYYASHANCFISVSAILQQAAKDRVLVSVPTAVIPNVVSPLFFETKKKKDSKCFTYLAVGRLVPIKQFDKIITAFLNTFSNNEKVQLKIIGSGIERSNLINLTDGDPRITFTGELCLEDVAREMSDADALVSYSEYETFANPVAEAWACGKPVIISDKSGISSYVNKKLGLIVNYSSEKDLEKALKFIYKNYSIYSAEYMRDFAEKEFSDQSIIHKLETVYKIY